MEHRKVGALLARLGWALLIPIVVLTGCVQAGKGGTMVSGSSGGATSVDADASLERCEAALGTLALDDGRRERWYRSFYKATKVTTVEPLIRLVVQQSNCFVITSIGNLRTNKRLRRITQIQRKSGEYRTGSKQHKGQRVAADYFLEPNIIISDASTGGFGIALGGMIAPGVGAMLGSSLESRDSVVTLTLTDIRSGVQVAASEGSSTASSFGGVIGALGGGAGGGFGGMSRTPAGKATVAAFVDAYNGLVRALRNYKAQDVEGGLGRGGTLKVN